MLIKNFRRLPRWCRLKIRTFTKSRLNITFKTTRSSFLQTASRQKSSCHNLMWQNRPRIVLLKNSRLNHMSPVLINPRFRSWLLGAKIITILKRKLNWQVSCITSLHQREAETISILVVLALILQQMQLRNSRGRQQLHINQITITHLKDLQWLPLLVKLRLL